MAVAPETPPADVEQRVLLLTPTRRDAEVTASFLSKAGLRCTICADLKRLAAEMDLGAGAVLLTEQAIEDESADYLVHSLSPRPAWSALPLVMLVRGGLTGSSTTE